MMSDFFFIKTWTFSGIIRLWILFKSSILPGVLSQSLAVERGGLLPCYSQVGVEFQVPFMTCITAEGEAGCESFQGWVGVGALACQ